MAIVILTPSHKQTHKQTFKFTHTSTHIHTLHTQLLWTGVIRDWSYPILKGSSECLSSTGLASDKLPIKEGFCVLFPSILDFVFLGGYGIDGVAVVLDSPEEALSWQSKFSPCPSRHDLSLGEVILFAGEQAYLCSGSRVLYTFHCFVLYC